MVRSSRAPGVLELRRADVDRAACVHAGDQGERPLTAGAFLEQPDAPERAVVATAHESRSASGEASMRAPSWLTDSAISASACSQTWCAKRSLSAAFSAASPAMPDV